MQFDGMTAVESSSACLTTVEACVAFPSFKPIGLGGSFLYQAVIVSLTINGLRWRRWLWHGGMSAVVHGILP